MTAFPTGTVTFLFTDIEGSTARWEHGPRPWPPPSPPRRAAGDVASRSGGHVIRSKGEGDSAFAVFGRAGDALARRPPFAVALGVAASKVVMWGGGHLAQHILHPIHYTHLELR